MSGKCNFKALIKVLPLVLLSGCIDFKGADDPFRYTSRTPHTIWRPPTEPSRIPEDLEEEFGFLEDVEPLSLGEVLDLSLLNNPRTKLAWAMARVSAAEYGQSLQDDFVQANINASWKRLKTSIFVLGQRSNLLETIWGTDLTLSYIFLDFGQTRYTSKAALESLYNADWMHNRSIQTVIQTVMNDYYDYLYQNENLISAKADVYNAQVTLDAAEAKLRNGMADVSDKVQAVTSLKHQQLNVVNQKQNLHNSYTKLLSNIGIPSNLDIKLMNYPKEIKTFDVESLDKLILLAMGNRPDLLAAEAQVKSRKNALIAAKRLYFPTVNGGFDIGRNYFSRGFDNTHWMGTVALSFPLFQGFMIRNTVKLAEGELDGAEADLDKTRLNVLQDVTNYREDVVLAKEALTYAKEFLQAAEIEFKVLLDQYRVGTTTIVDVINAQTSVADARAQYAESVKNWWSSLANLAYGTGSLALSNSQDQNLFEDKEDEENSSTGAPYAPMRLQQENKN